MKKQPQKNLIPDSEIDLDFARSGGPGGQKVNKTESKVILRWNVAESGALSDAQKSRVFKRLKNRINRDKELVLQVDEERSQARNRDIAVERLNALVQKAVKRKKKRKPTKPSRRQRAKRVEEKRKHSRKKELRKPPDITRSI